MEHSLNLHLPLSFQQLIDLVRQLPKVEQEKLVVVLQKEILEEEPSKATVLEEIRQDYLSLQQGTLKTRPLKDILNEL